MASILDGIPQGMVENLPLWYLFPVGIFVAGLVVTSLLQNANPACLEYEVSRLDTAIEKVSAILAKYNDHPHAYEYYSTMQECLLALNWSLERTLQLEKRLSLMECRINVNDYAVGQLLIKI